MRELLLSLNNCSFGYSKNKIFENLFFNINDGDKIALVGRNGVGKTTLMDILSKKKTIDDGKSWFLPNLTTGYLVQKKKNKLFLEVQGNSLKSHVKTKLILTSN